MNRLLARQNNLPVSLTIRAGPSSRNETPEKDFEKVHFVAFSFARSSALFGFPPGPELQV